MIFTHADAQFRSSNLTVRAESVGGSTPGARITWSTTLPPECVTSVSVNFRNTVNGRLEAINSTTNSSQTEIIQTGFSVLQATTSQWWLVENQDIEESQLISFCQAIKCRFLLEVRK